MIINLFDTESVPHRDE